MKRIHSNEDNSGEYKKVRLVGDSLRRLSLSGRKPRRNNSVSENISRSNSNSNVNINKNKNNNNNNIENEGKLEIAPVFAKLLKNPLAGFFSKEKNCTALVKYVPAKEEIGRSLERYYNSLNEVNDVEMEDEVDMDGDIDMCG